MTTSGWERSSAKAHVRQGQLLREHLVLATGRQRRTGRILTLLARAKFLGILTIVGLIAGFGAVVAFRSVSDGLGTVASRVERDRHEQHDRDAVSTARNRAMWSSIRRS